MFENIGGFILVLNRQRNGTETWTIFFRKERKHWKVLHYARILNIFIEKCTQIGFLIITASVCVFGLHEDKIWCLFTAKQDYYKTDHFKYININTDFAPRIISMEYVNHINYKLVIKLFYNMWTNIGEYGACFTWIWLA